MKQTYCKTIAATILAASFTFVGNVAGSEDYDVDAFGPQDPITWNSPIKATFSHRIHTDDAELECDSCHDDIFIMEEGAAVKTSRFNMASLAAGEFCGACHDGDTAFASDENCAACHSSPSDPILWTKPVKAVVFQHTLHTEEYGLECDSCHNEPFTMKIGAAEASSNFTMKSLYNGDYCGKCHDGDTAFASNTLCTSCHIGVKGYDRMVEIASQKGSAEGSIGGH